MNLNILFVLLLMFSNPLWSQISRNFKSVKKPLYELGVGAGYIKVPNYPGAKNSSFHFIPFPVFVYRGDLLRADEDGTRARLFKSENVELGLSGGFNFPIKEQDNKTRKGMGDTDALIGVGPGLLVKLYNDALHRLTTGVGVRVNFSAGVFPDLKENGLLIEPNIRYWYRPSRQSRLTIFNSLSISFADNKYNSFFYEVKNSEQNENREVFRAKSGFVDMAASFGLNYDFKNKLSIFMGVVYSNLTLSPNKESDLLEEEHNIGGGIGFIFPFFESSSLVN